MMSKINVEELLGRYNLFQIYSYSNLCDFESLYKVFYTSEQYMDYLRNVDKDIYVDSYDSYDNAWDDDNDDWDFPDSGYDTDDEFDADDSNNDFVFDDTSLITYGYIVDDEGSIIKKHIFDYNEENAILLKAGRDDILKERLIIMD